MPERADDPITVAHGVLDDLQRAVAAKDHDAVLALMTSDVVLFGTAAANLDRAATSDYLCRVLAADGVLRWAWTTVRVVDARPGAITFVALGTAGFDGDPADEAREPIRLTAVVVDEGERWRLAHFHGSTPAPG